MATPDNDAQNPLANDEATAAADRSSQKGRRSEAEERASRGQSLAMGDTGDGDTGVKSDTQGISNRPGDTPEDDG